MKITNTQKFKTGIFIMLGFGILLLFTFIIANQKNLFTSTFPVYGQFNNISGLVPGNLVRFAGINIGTVETIDIINDSTVKVGLSLQEKVRPFIKSDSRLSIGSDGLMGDKLILVSAGSALPGKPVQNNQLLAGINPFEMDKLTLKINSIVVNAEQVLGSLSVAMNKINSGQGSLGRLLNDDKIAKNLETTLATTSKTVKTIDKAASGLGENMEAAKHNILLRGYFKKKERKKQQAAKRLLEQTKAKENEKEKKTTPDL
jgi:phospholipid/cholesterol/gamma-HCH transport system substrate-binding protein